jgi:hypothetical protein
MKLLLLLLFLPLQLLGLVCADNAAAVVAWCPRT